MGVSVCLKITPSHCYYISGEMKLDNRRGVFLKNPLPHSGSDSFVKGIENNI